MRKRIDNLDILRAFALILICVYHWFLFKGTYIGVVIFFSLSGYLFTSSLLKKNFLYKEVLKSRIGKLIPSLLAVILFSTIFLFILNNGLELKYKYSVIASLLGLNNIYQIISKISYFESYGMLLPLTHIWALSFQTQLYILIPLFIMGAKKIKLKNNTIGIIFLILSILSALWMGYTFYIGEDISRIYYGTDTRAFSFLAAAGIGAFYVEREITGKIEKFIISILGIFGFLGIILFSFYINYQNPLNYYGLMYLTSILTTSLILFLAKINIRIPFKVISTPFILLGRHQYQYYLWQYPIMIFSKEIFKWSSLKYEEIFLTQLTALIIISEISYYIFEKEKNFYLSKKSFAYTAIGAISGILFCSPIYENIDLEEMKKIQSAEIPETEINKVDVNKDTKPSEIEKETPTTDGKASELPEKQTQEEKLKNLESTVAKTSEEDGKIQKEILSIYPDDNRNILFIGDSVLKMSALDLKKKYPNSTIDTKVGRQFHDLPGILTYLKQNDKIPQIVVIALGTNGTIYPKDMKKALETLEGREVYFINTVTPDPWETSVNNEIKTAANGNPGIQMIDWYSYSKGKKEYFYKDGTHPRPHAALRYVNLIYSTLSKGKI